MIRCNRRAGQSVSGRRRHGSARTPSQPAAALSDSARRTCPLLPLMSDISTTVPGWDCDHRNRQTAALLAADLALVPHFVTERQRDGRTVLVIIPGPIRHVLHALRDRRSRNSLYIEGASFRCWISSICRSPEFGKRNAHLQCPICTAVPKIVGLDRGRYRTRGQRPSR